MEKEQASLITTITLNPALDQTLAFPVFRLGALNRVESVRMDPGGKGINVAKVIRALGSKVQVTGFLGQDNAAVFERYFQQHAISDRFIRVPGDTRVNIKIVEDSGELSEINFPGINCSKKELTELTSVIEELGKTQGVFVLAGSIPRGIEMQIYRKYVKLLKDAGCTVFLDTSGDALVEGIKSKPDLIKPNISELSQLVGRELTGEAEMFTVMEEILAGGVEEIVVSLGSRGAAGANRKERVIVRPPKVQAKSVVGAGDAMVAGLAVGTAGKLSLAERLRLGTATAVASVILPGTQSCSMQDVQKILPQIAIEIQK